jgi:endonuclease/exonuclease/phosphatase family metal-dependent hydrolase
VFDPDARAVPFSARVELAQTRQFAESRAMKNSQSCLARLPVILAPILLALVMSLPVASVLGADAAGRSSDTLCVMAYNVRYASPNPPNAWSQRRPIMRDMLQQVSPDVIGTQEGVYEQLKDIAADLPEHDWIGLGRDGGSRGEFMAVYYRKSRLEPLAFDHFWLSDTPETMGSRTWGPTHSRMVTWVRFLDRQTRQEFYFINTHFDHRVQEAREKSAELVRSRVEALNTTLPVLLAGDFNAVAGQNKTYSLLVGDGYFADTWNTAAKRTGEGINTFNEFKEIMKDGKRIDWILSRGNVIVDATEIVTYSRDGQFPSDHFPVVAWLRFKAEK